MHTDAVIVQLPPAWRPHAGLEPGAYYVFGEFALHPARKLLERGQTPVMLGGRAFDLLVALVARAGQVVGHHALMAAVWPHAVVEENGLRVHVSALRKTLGDSPADPYVLTVPGCGYRFVKPVRAFPSWPDPTGCDGCTPCTVLETSVAGRHQPPGGQPIYAFGGFRLLRQARQLFLGPTPVRLGGRALALLLVLVERAGEVLSRAELERTIWPDSVVEDSCLRVHIGALRRALGDGPGPARYIANIPGRGYSFVAPVVVLGPIA